MAFQQFANSANPATTLSAGCTNVATTISVASAANLPTIGNFTIGVVTSSVIEFMLVTNVSGTTLTVTRAQEGTSGAAHNTSDSVYLIFTAGALAQVLADHNQVGTYASAPTSATGARNGMRYKCTDAPYEFIFNGSIWQPFYQGIKVTPPPAYGTLTAANFGSNPHGVASDELKSMLITLNGQGNSNEYLGGLVKTYPASTPFSFVIGIDVLSLMTQNYCYLGFFFRDSVGSKLSIGGMAYSDNQWAWFWAKWAGYDQGSNSVYVNVRIASPGAGGIVFLRFRDDGTYRFIEASRDLVNWFSLNNSATLSRTDYFTPNQLGIGIGQAVVNVSTSLVRCVFRIFHWTGL